MTEAGNNRAWKDDVEGRVARRKAIHLDSDSFCKRGEVIL